MGFILRMAITALGLYLADLLFDDIVIEDNRTLVFAALLLGLVNAVVRPVVVLLTLPITVLTLGLFLLVVNAMMLGLVAYVLDGLQIHHWAAAVFGSMVISFTGWIGASFIGSHGIERLEVIEVHGRGPRFPDR